MFSHLSKVILSLSFVPISFLISTKALADVYCLNTASQFIYRNTSDSRSQSKERARYFCLNGGDAGCLQSTADWIYRNTSSSRYQAGEEALRQCQHPNHGDFEPSPYPEDGRDADGSIGHSPFPPSHPIPQPVPVPQPPPPPPPPPPVVHNPMICAGTYDLVHNIGANGDSISAMLVIHSDAAGNLSATLTISDGRVANMTGVCQPQGPDRATAQLNYQGHPQLVKFAANTIVAFLPSLGISVAQGAKR